MIRCIFTRNGSQWSCLARSIAQVDWLMGYYGADLVQVIPLIKPVPIS